MSYVKSTGTLTFTVRKPGQDVTVGKSYTVLGFNRFGWAAFIDDAGDVGHLHDVRKLVEDGAVSFANPTTH